MIASFFFRSFGFYVLGTVHQPWSVSAITSFYSISHPPPLPPHFRSRTGCHMLRCTAPPRLPFLRVISFRDNKCRVTLRRWRDIEFPLLPYCLSPPSGTSDRYRCLFLLSCCVQPRRSLVNAGPLCDTPAGYRLHGFNPAPASFLTESVPRHTLRPTGPGQTRRPDSLLEKLGMTFFPPVNKDVWTCRYDFCFPFWS